MDNQKSKRDAILFSALKIFERDGFHRAKVEDIAKGANVGKGTIYEYFASKKDLFFQMVKNMIDIYYEMIKQIAEENTDPITKLKKFINLQVELVEKHGNLGNVIQVEVIKSGMKDELKAVFFEFRIKQMEMIQKILEEGIELDLFKKGNTYMATLFFIGGINQFAFEKNKSTLCGTIEECSDDNEELDVSEFVNAFLTGLMK